MTGTDRIADCDHDEGYPVRLLFHRKRRWRSGGNDHVYLRRDKIVHQRRKPFVFSFRPEIVDNDIAPLVAEFAQTLAKRSDEIDLERGSGIAHEPDAGNFLLCSHAERPADRCAGKKPEDLASSH